jgi:hypothetical protein
MAQRSTSYGRKWKKWLAASAIKPAAPHGPWFL